MRITFSSLAGPSRRAVLEKCLAAAEAWQSAVTPQDGLQKSPEDR
ncbi:hypothetical protein [Rhizorhabdus wittichii]|nr:hypothetical protein [Rhizorhabdus wittichii]